MLVCMENPGKNVTVRDDSVPPLVGAALCYRCRLKTHRSGWCVERQHADAPERASLVMGYFSEYFSDKYPNCTPRSCGACHCDAVLMMASTGVWNGRRRPTSTSSSRCWAARKVSVATGGGPISMRPCIFDQ